MPQNFQKLAKICVYNLQMSSNNQNKNEQMFDLKEGLFSTIDP